MRYICAHFQFVANDPLIGLLKYEQLVLLLKNKFVNATNEDVVLFSLENWI
jgi:hypothetical protein